MPRGEGERSNKAKLPVWWVELFLEIRNQRNDTLVALGRGAAAAVGRAKAWDHSAVKKFIDGDSRSYEMAEGLSDVYGIPRPIYRPQTRVEAFAVQAALKQLEASVRPPKATPDRKRKLAQADQHLESMEQHADDHTERLDSQDERVTGRRRAGRAARSRATPS